MKKGTIKLSDKDLKSKKSASSESAYTLPSPPDYSSMSEEQASEVERGGDFSFIPSYAGGERGKQYEKFGEQEPSAPQRKSALNMLGVSSPLNKRGLWDNIHAKRKRGEKMRKKGDPGAPTDEAIKDSQ
jgi:hypothetical protein